MWVTRTSPGALRTGAALRRLGFDPVIAPLLEVRHRTFTLDLLGVGALAFTSPNGVVAFARARRERHLQVFAVGDATACAARRAGFAHVLSAGGNVGDLVRLIAVHAPALRGALVRLGAADPAGDIVADLAAHGVRALSVPVYDAIARPMGGDLPYILGESGRRLAAVLAHSPRAARRLAELFVGREPPAPMAVCISRAAADPLQPLGFPGLRVAARPDEAGLLAALCAD